jgi:hypothetical protein
VQKINGMMNIRIPPFHILFLAFDTEHPAIADFPKRLQECWKIDLPRTQRKLDAKTAGFV